MSIISAMVDAEKKKLLAQFAPEEAKIEAEVAKVEAAVAPALASITPADELAAVQMVFPKLSAEEAGGIVTAFGLLVNLGSELAAKAAAAAKA